MTTALVISDTHGNQELLRRALTTHVNVDTIIHLGDYTEDIEPYAELLRGKRIYAAPGKYDREYEYGRLPLLCRASFENWRIIFVHDRRTVPADWLPTADFVFYGHTHKPAYEVEADVAFVNPGHLKDETDRGSAASCLLVEFRQNEAILTWRTPEGVDYREERRQR
jgi:putative phosphoesterase